MRGATSSWSTDGERAQLIEHRENPDALIVGCDYDPRIVRSVANG
jgi:hypothetical protein